MEDLGELNSGSAGNAEAQYMQGWLGRDNAGAVRLMAPFFSVLLPLYSQLLRAPSDFRQGSKEALVHSITK